MSSIAGWFRAAAAALLLAPAAATAQLAPQIGYVHPAGAQAGTTVDVRIGGLDWTPDMQLFMLDPGVTLEIVGPPGPVIVAEPPYWFGKKARGPDFPMAREIPARLTITAGTPPGIVRYQAANANGATAVGKLVVGAEPDVVEEPRRREPQVLPAPPVAVSGQVARIEEVDRYQFSAPQAGLVTGELFARRLGSPLNAIVEVRDPAGRLLVNEADTEGRDFSFTFAAAANVPYTVSIYDVDFRGNRQYTYRLALRGGPRVVAAIPTAGRRGETRQIELVGYGVASGAAKLESVTRDVTLPADSAANTFNYRLETPHGAAAPFSLGVETQDQTVETRAGSEAIALSVPAAVTGVLEERFGTDRYAIRGEKGKLFRISVEAARFGSPLDVSLAIVGPEGKELAVNDDLPGTTDAGLTFAVPADGTYELVVSDTSGQSGTRASVYRLMIEPAAPDFAISIPEMASIALGGKVNLAVKIQRQAGFKDPVQLAIAGLPPGVAPTGDLLVAANAADFNIPLECAADAASTASLAKVTARAKIGEAMVERTSGSVLIAATMKPRCTLVSEGKDDVRKVHRGSTFPAPVLITRLEGYTGEVMLEMTSMQQRHRQGLAGPDMVVPAGVERFEYPIFLPEWMETTKTSRVILNAVVKVPDPKGNVRYLVNKMVDRIGMLPQGALLKLSGQQAEQDVVCGQPFEIPLVVSKANELVEPVKLELHVSDELAARLTAAAVTINPGQKEVLFRVLPVEGGPPAGEHEVVVRATALQQGRLLVMSEATVKINFVAAR
jgi:hypothetical protein